MHWRTWQSNQGRGATREALNDFGRKWYSHFFSPPPLRSCIILHLQVQFGVSVPLPQRSIVLSRTVKWVGSVDPFLIPTRPYFLFSSHSHTSCLGPRDVGFEAPKEGG